MKRIYWLILFLAGSLKISAQDTLAVYKSKGTNHLIQLDVAVGTNIDLRHSPSGDMLALLSDRKRVAPAFDLRLLHFFSRKWGWYMDLSLDLDVGKRKDYYAELFRPLEEDYYIKRVNEFYETNKSRVNSHFGLGIVYRIESARWNFYPRTGIGANIISYQPIYAELKQKGGNALYNVQYRNSDELDNIGVGAWFIGMSTNYKVSKNCFLFLDATYSQPMGRVTLHYTKTDQYTKKTLEESTYRSSTVGRFLKVTAGVGVPFYLKGKKGQGKSSSHSTRMKEMMDKKRKDFGIFPRNN